jgi:hypothetical protein
MPRSRAADAVRCTCFALLLAITALTLRAPMARAEDADAPPDLSGDYTFTGLMQDSSTCSGTFAVRKRMTVSPHDGPRYNSYDVKMQYGGGWKGVGVGTFIDGYFNFAVAPGDKYLAVVTYRPMVLSPAMVDLKRQLQEKERSRPGGMLEYNIKGDPWWADAWTYKHYGVFFRADGAWGFENLGPEHLGDSPPLGDGTWSFHRWYYDNKGKRDILDSKTGKVTATVKGDAVEIQQSYRSSRNGYDDAIVNAGLMPNANMLVAVFNGSGSEAVGSLQLVGMTLTGRTCDSTDLALGYITLGVPDAVVKRNPGLFH